MQAFNNLGFYEKDVKQRKKEDFIKEGIPEEFKDFADYYLERKHSFYEKKRKENYKLLINVNL